MSLAIVVAVASVVPVLCYASFLLLKKLKAKGINWQNNITTFNDGSNSNESFTELYF